MTIIELIRNAQWVENPKYAGLHELIAESDEMLAWVQKRPNYCDRGHWHGHLEYSPGNTFDFADGNPAYYMRLDVAKQEMREKLLWRNYKIRVE